MSAHTGQPPLLDVTGTEDSLRRFLHGLPGVDAVGLEARAAALNTRSVKADAKLSAIDTAIRMIDLTTLEGADTECSVRGLCALARHPDAGHPYPGHPGPGHPDPARPDVPAVAAVCVYPDRVATAVHALSGSGVEVASVAGAFPSGRSALQLKLADTTLAVTAGATEIDMVIDRAAFLSGRYGQVFEEIAAVREASAGARLKVILETGELATYDNVRRAGWLALLAGADFIKTSTGKTTPAATLPVVGLMLQTVRDFHRVSGTRRGVKAAGGIRTTKDAIRYLVAVIEVAGPEWLSPRLFRFGASGLLGDLLRQRRTQLEGHYSSADYLAVG